MTKKILGQIKYSKLMSCDRSESAQNVTNHMEGINDGTPLYYCDRNNKSNGNTRKAEQSLYAVSAVTVIFIIIEFLGGYFANSLAIMTDAGHMISDLLSFCVAIVAMKLAQKKPTKRLPFGYYRAEILGALISVVMIWALTAILVYAAVERIIEQNFDVDATVMLYTAAISVLFNVIMGIILHFGKTAHSHFGMSSHSHGNEKTFPIDLEEGSCKVYQNDMKDMRCEQDNNANIIKTVSVTDHDHHMFEFGANINIRAAFVHVLGDLLQSLGVLFAALIIKFTDYPLADPICTFLFSILVMLTSFSVARDSVLILMEASPKHIDVDTLYNELCAIEGVRDVHSLRVWSLTMDKVALSVHLDTEKNCDSNHVVHEVNEKLKYKHGIHFITIQAQCICNRSVSCQSFSTATVTPIQDILRK
ncbi:cation diffusion facilitator transporter family protein [Acanthocheilonema viteae]